MHSKDADIRQTVLFQSDLGLHCLSRHVCPEAQNHYGTLGTVLKDATAGLSKNLGLFQYIGERYFLLFNLKDITADTCDIFEFPFTTHQVWKLHI